MGRGNRFSSENKNTTPAKEDSPIAVEAQEPEKETDAPPIPPAEPSSDYSFFLIDGSDLFSKFSTAEKSRIADAFVTVDNAAHALAKEGREVAVAVTLRKTKSGKLSAIIGGAGLAPVTVEAE